MRLRGIAVRIGFSFPNQPISYDQPRLENLGKWISAALQRQRSEVRILLGAPLLLIYNDTAIT